MRKLYIMFLIGILFAITHTSCSTVEDCPAYSQAEVEKSIEYCV